jgi:hypothetical protein
MTPVVALLAATTLPAASCGPCSGGFVVGGGHLIIIKSSVMIIKSSGGFVVGGGHFASLRTAGSCR